MLRISAAFVAFVGLASPALACSYIPSDLPWEQLLAEEPVIFIGTVLMTDESAALFAVDEPIRGVSRNWTEVEQGQGADCRIPFEAGQQWIFAGTFIGGPSLQLTPPLDNEERDAITYARSLGN